MIQFLEYAQQVLEHSAEPLTFQEIWKKGVEMGINKNLATSGKTPWATLGARLFVEVRDNPDSLFTKIGKRPAKFFLKSKLNLLTPELIENIDKEESQPSAKKTKTSYSERELHPLLTYFAYSNTQFNNGKAILTKTIFHEQSKKSGLNEWVHPDIVGVYIPIEDWSSEIIELNRISNANAIELLSFEMKKEINRANYREYFFQAVSNSSWANEGYLVAADISEDDELMNELERLSTSFGIGVIQLDLDDIDASSILFHASKKKELDWETMNKLCEINSNFKKFIQDVKIDFDSKRIHKSEYDEILKEPESYIKKIKREN
ncbi:MAG: HrgA protein [Treponema sp.]|nr:HrgA protein [Treponema sp.]